MSRTIRSYPSAGCAAARTRVTSGTGGTAGWCTTVTGSDVQAGPVPGGAVRGPAVTGGEPVGTAGAAEGGPAGSVAALAPAQPARAGRTVAARARSGRRESGAMVCSFRTRTPGSRGSRLHDAPGAQVIDRADG